jgi:polyhydroxyalkanoate synthesis regulator phasin
LIRFWRAGFGRDIAALLLVTIVLGSMLAGGVSAAVDKYFAGTVRNLIGDFGEYDVIVHVREEAREAAATALNDLLQERLSGFRLKSGLTVAGKANFFVGIPHRKKSRNVFESFGKWVATLPGYAGLTFITEPSVLVNNVHPGVRRTLSESLSAVDGVRFVFQDGSNLIAVLDSPAEAEAVYEAARSMAARYRILEIRFPFEYRVADAQEAAGDVEKSLENMWGKDAVRDVTVAGQEDQMGSFVTALREMKRFLVSYATQVEIRLTTPGGVMTGDTLELGDASGRVAMRVSAVNGDRVRGYVEQGDAGRFLRDGTTAYHRSGKDRRPVGRAVLTNERMQLVEGIDASLELLSHLQELSHDADGAVQKAEDTLKTFEAALVQLDVVQEQVRQINEELTTKGQVSTSELLMSVLLSSLVKKVQPKSEPADLQQVDVPGMQAALREISQRLNAMAQVDMDAIAREVRRVRDNLPQLNDSEIGDSLRLIDKYLEGQVLPGDRLQFLLQPQVDVEQSEALIGGVLKRNDVVLFTTPAAVVSPDARATLFSVLSDVRRTIAGIATLVLALLAMLLDHATVFSSLRVLQENQGPRRRRILHPATWFEPVDGWAAVTGVLLVAGMYVGSRAGIPGLSFGHVVLIGAVLGFGVSKLALRISPVNSEEVAAGLALGLNSAQVMREIVVPSGRPGLLLLLNRRHQVFVGVR